MAFDDNLARSLFSLSSLPFPFSLRQGNARRTEPILASNQPEPVPPTSGSKKPSAENSAPQNSGENNTPRLEQRKQVARGPPLSWRWELEASVFSAPRPSLSKYFRFPFATRKARSATTNGFGSATKTPAQEQRRSKTSGAMRSLSLPLSRGIRQRWRGKIPSAKVLLIRAMRLLSPFSTHDGGSIIAKKLLKTSTTNRHPESCNTAG